MRTKRKKSADKHLWIPDVIGMFIELFLYAPRLIVRVIRAIFTN
ncbi:hypothetical protein [Halalkalibacter wakoensis]|nr:hypothetical protein [Halalkalibacter wakoensis]